MPARRRRQGPDGMPSGVELVVGSRASVSVVDRSLVGSTTPKPLLMVDGSFGGSTKAAQAFWASSWRTRSNEGRPAGASWGPASVDSIVVSATVAVARQERAVA